MLILETRTIHGANLHIVHHASKIITTSNPSTRIEILTMKKEGVEFLMMRSLDRHTALVRREVGEKLSGRLSVYEGV